MCRKHQLGLSEDYGHNQYDWIIRTFLGAEHRKQSLRSHCILFPVSVQQSEETQTTMVKDRMKDGREDGGRTRKDVKNAKEDNRGRERIERGRGRTREDER